jgi:hypothetical protein
MVYQQDAQAKITYHWRKGFPNHGVSAQDAGEALAAIHATYGDITPEKICAAARPRNSLLHPLIEWNRSKAATAYQLHQASALRGACQRVVVYYVDKEKRETVIQAFVAHPLDKRPTNGTNGQCFVPVARILSEAEAREATIERALDELAAWRRRYEAFHELGELFAAIDAQLAAV